VGPGEHAGGLLLIKQLEAHEEPEHRAAERLGQPGGVVGGPRDERPTREDQWAPTDAEGRYAPFEITQIVDRIGCGDAFSAGLIFA